MSRDNTLWLCDRVFGNLAQPDETTFDLYYRWNWDFDDIGGLSVYSTSIMYWDAWEKRHQPEGVHSLWKWKLSVRKLGNSKRSKNGLNYSERKMNNGILWSLASYKKKLEYLKNWNEYNYTTLSSFNNKNLEEFEWAGEYEMHFWHISYSEK